MLAAGLVAACSSPTPAPTASSAAPVTGPTPSSAATPTPTPTPSLLSPLTGLAVPALRPVLAVKIGNTSLERPPAGVEDADVVYVEMVEGGLTRLLAMFSSRLPAEVGPVRSARETDVQLLGEYGPIALAYSGAYSSVQTLLGRTSLRLVSFDASAKGYRRDPTRPPAPDDVMGSPSALLSRVSKVATAKDVGFRFGPLPAGGRAVTTLVARFPLARISANWDVASGTWLLSVDGATWKSVGGTRLAPTSIIVQYVQESYLSRRDAHGTPVPFAHTVGSGKAVVLRGGQALAATWSRRSAAAATTWTLADGSGPALLAPGQVWVLLLPSTRAVQLQ